MKKATSKKKKKKKKRKKERKKEGMFKRNTFLGTCFYHRRIFHFASLDFGRFYKFKWNFNSLIILHFFISKNLPQFFQRSFLSHSMKIICPFMIFYAQKCLFKPIYFIHKIKKWLNILLKYYAVKLGTHWSFNWVLTEDFKFWLKSNIILAWEVVKILHYWNKQPPKVFYKKRGS